MLDISNNSSCYYSIANAKNRNKKISKPLFFIFICFMVLPINKFNNFCHNLYNSKLQQNAVMFRLWYHPHAYNLS